MKITNKNNLSQAFVNAVNKEYTYQDKRYSATSLLKGTKEAILLRRHNDEIECDVSDMVNLILGSAFHKIMENCVEENCVAEMHYELPMDNGYVLSGIVDKYNQVTGDITDYKTTSVYTILFDNYEEWYNQLSIYKYALNKLGYKTNEIAIEYLIKDYKPSDYERALKKGEFYPSTQIDKIVWANDCDPNWIENWIKEKFADIEKCEQLADDDIPFCTPEERWQDGGRYAVMKNNNKTAEKLYDREKDAQAHINYLEQEDAKNGKKNTYRIEERKTVDKKCKKYCLACKYCNYWKMHYGDEENGK